MPLYEAYVAIWQATIYSITAAGVTHSTAYNFYHNKFAARIAKLIGEDAAPFEHEADLILKALKQNLWIRNKGWFGEYKDLLGLQRVHESAALWTFYHAVDSETIVADGSVANVAFCGYEYSHILFTVKMFRKGILKQFPRQTGCLTPGQPIML